MLKTQTFTLTGRDAGTHVTLRELPALVADRAARAILKACDFEPDGGVMALAFKYLKDVRATLGEAALIEFDAFVDVRERDRPTLRDYRNVTRMQDAALMLHAGFIVAREAVEIPIAMQAESIQAGNSARVSYCSPFISAVINSRYASYVELETVLSTEDAYNLAETINVEAVRDWRASQRKPSP